MMTIEPIYTGIVEGFPIRFFRSLTPEGGVRVFHDANDLATLLAHKCGEKSSIAPNQIETAWHQQRRWVRFNSGAVRYAYIAPNVYVGALLDALTDDGVISEQLEFAYYTEAGIAQKLAAGRQVGSLDCAAA